MFEIKKRRKKIELLNGEINKLQKEIADLERIYGEINKLQKEIADLERIKDSLNNDYPGIDKLVALVKKLNELREEIAKQEFALDEIRQMQQGLKNLADIEKEKVALTSEISELAKKRQNLNELVETKKIIFATYKMPKFEGINIDAFAFDKTTEYHENSTGNKCTGAIYKSLGGSRIIGFTSQFNDYIINSSKPMFNATPIQYITFEEACIELGRDEYLKEYIHPQEVYEVLKEYRMKFDLYNGAFSEFISQARELNKGKTF